MPLVLSAGRIYAVASFCWLFFLLGILVAPERFIFYFFY